MTPPPFRSWLRRHRGIGDVTIAKYVKTLALVLPDLGSDPQLYDAALIRDVMLSRFAKVAPEYAREMTKALRDPSPVVGVAAARALCRLGKPSEALPVLVEVLRGGEQWERLHAAIVLDEIDRMANPVKEAMRAALRPRKDLYAEGKYVVRVLNRALNQLEGTHNEVP